MGKISNKYNNSTDNSTNIIFVMITWDEIANLDLNDKNLLKQLKLNPLPIKKFFKSNDAKFQYYKKHYTELLTTLDNCINQGEIIYENLKKINSKNKKEASYAKYYHVEYYMKSVTKQKILMHQIKFIFDILKEINSVSDKKY